MQKKPLKVLLVCRLFSGFETSLQSGIWKPTGAPTIAHLIKNLDAAPEISLKILLTQKNFSNHPTKDGSFFIKGISSPFYVYRGPHYFPPFLGRLRDKLSETRHFLMVLKEILFYRPSILYFDRVNILSASLCSRFLNIPVVWRIMGILPGMKEDLKSPSMRSKIRRWLYRSPFAMAICTQDGSGGNHWMASALNKKTEKHLLLNGVDKKRKKNVRKFDLLKFKKDKIYVLFVGRIEKIKGIFEFLDAFKIAHKKNPKIFAVIAGTGDEIESAQNYAKEHLFEKSYIFLGNLDSDELSYLRKKCDLYVSLNKQGNLSNVNLEALSDGICTIIPNSCAENYIDTDTDTLIPQDIFYRFGENCDAISLSKALNLLAKNHVLRKKMSENTHRLSKKILTSWEERIDKEITLIKKTAS